MAASEVAASTGLVPALYAGVGAILGGVITAVASYLITRHQQSQQNRRDLVRMAVDLAMAEYAHDMTLARDRAASGHTSHIAPLASYVLTYETTLDRLSRGPMTTADIRAIQDYRDALLALFPGYAGAGADEDGVQ